MKKLCLLLLVFTLLFTMTACQSGPKVTVEESSRPETTPIYSNADFRYGNIGWNSSYSDVVREYGEPRVIHNNDSVWAFFYDVKVSYYTVDARQFDFNQNTGRLVCIHVCIGTGFTVNNQITMKEAEKLSQTLEYKYGEPDEKKTTRKDGVLSEIDMTWENVYEKTYIRIWAYVGYGDNVSCSITYVNRDDTNPIRHSDLPTPEPTSIPTPTLTPNLNGI